MNTSPALALPDTDLPKLRQAIAALEAQRSVMGDEFAELALMPLRKLLAAAESSPRLRRAQVTILFADIVESAEMARQLDAEDVLDIFGGVLQDAAGCVNAHGGKVLRFTGDGLKAAFGTQGAHEDDAVQAVQAGLEILAVGRRHAERRQQRPLSRPLAFRVGVHTGEVAFGAGFEGEQTLTGDAVNVAARMEHSAPPGALRVSADTWAHLRGRFVADAQGPLQLKGLGRPMHTWLVRAPVEASHNALLDQDGIHGLQASLIGREVELELLKQAIVGGRKSGGLRVVTLVGDAGLGKSRLLREASKGAVEDGHPLLSAQAQPRDRLQPWGVLRHLVSGHCRIADSDSADAARRKLLAGLMPAFDSEPESQAQLIGQLIGLDFTDAPALAGLDARALRDRALVALIGWLAALSREGPGPVLVIEDLHWADEASVDALAYLMANGRQLPLALLMSCRPELLDRRPDWGHESEDRSDRRVLLTPLAADQCDALTAALLPGLEPVPPALQALLTGRSEGNPFYIQELVRHVLNDRVVVDGGGHWTFDAERMSGLRLPTTLVGLLQSRLDALPDAARAAAQHASIVGHVFWDAALAEIDPSACDALPALQQHHWLQLQEPSAFDGTLERRFDHHLLHQVTYGTVLKEERRLGHASVARWLIERTAGRGPEFLAITGEHAERAGDDALAADCYERAAVAAQERFANALAIDCLQRALRLMPSTDAPRRLLALDRLREVADVVGDRELQGRTLDAMLADLQSHPDPHRLAEVTMSRAMLADRQGRMEDAFALSTDALTQATTIGNDDVAALAHAELCWLNFVRGDPEATLRHLSAGQACAENVRDTQPIRSVQLLMMAGQVAMHEDRLTDADLLLNQAMSSADGRFPRLQMTIMGLLSKQAWGLGDWLEAATRADRQAAVARQLGDTMRLGGALQDLALAALGSGDAKRALSAIGESVANLHAAGNVFNEAHAHVTAGDAYALQGDPHAARCAYERAQALFAQSDPRGSRAAGVSALIARQDLALGDPVRARVGAERAMEAFDADSLDRAPESVLAWSLACAEVWAALGDTRASKMIEQLQEAVRFVSTKRAGSADRARELQQRIPIYRKVMATPAVLTTSAAVS